MKNLLFSTCAGLVLLLFFAALPCLAQTPFPAEVDPGPEPSRAADASATPLQKENQRLTWVMWWAAKNKLSQRELLLKIYEPVIEGCKRDYPRNLKFAEICQGKADDNAKNGQEKGAKTWADAAKAFVALAKQEQIILKALDAGDGKAFDAAVAAIPKIEQQILDLTAHPVKRDWYLPGELGSLSAPRPAAPPATPTK